MAKLGEKFVADKTLSTIFEGINKEAKSYEVTGDSWDLPLKAFQSPQLHRDDANFNWGNLVSLCYGPVEGNISGGQLQMCDDLSGKKEKKHTITVPVIEDKGDYPVVIFNNEALKHGTGSLGDNMVFWSDNKNFKRPFRRLQLRLYESNFSLKQTIDWNATNNGGHPDNFIFNYTKQK